MKRFFILFISLFSSVTNADSSTFSRDRLTGFYDEFLCEEKNVLSEVGLTSSCDFNPNINPFVPPIDPPPPPFQPGLLPFIIINNSGYPDSEVYVLLTGKTTNASSQVFVDITPATGIGTLHDVMSGDNGSTYSYQLSQLPVASGGHVIYVPQMISGLVWFSVLDKLNMTVNGSNQIVQPAFSSAANTDGNYLKNFDVFEFTYLQSGSPQISADATAVSFFSIPLYGYLSGATSPSMHTGLYQPRSYIMSQAAATLNTAPLPERTQWQQLFLTSGSTILRLLAPGKGMAAAPVVFDQNYLDNLAAYGYSYINDIWTGGYYKTHTLTLTVGITNPSTATYTYMGTVNGMNQFVFTSMDVGAPAVTPFPAPTTLAPTTSYNILSALEFYPAPPVAGTADDAVSKLVQEAMVAGVIPTTDTISLSSLTGNQGNYYKVNPNLSAAGQSTGPWYDLYSKALHAVGSIYTFGFDDALWPQVLLGGPFVDNSTYLSITIGKLD